MEDEKGIYNLGHRDLIQESLIAGTVVEILFFLLDLSHL